MKKALFIIVLIVLANQTSAQCLMFNEIMINPSGSNDGTNPPNTAEWVEIYNICDEPVDVSCFALTDGDFALTFPQGTIIPANDYYTIGSNNSGIAIDFNWATCNCTNNTSNEVGIFTNGNEQLILVDDIGGLVNGIYWGSGQFPVNHPSPAMPGCPTQMITFNAPGIFFESIPYPTTEDCTASRLCDGSWSVTCGASATPDAVNGQELVIADFSFSDGQICAGECISFEDLSQGATGWEWTFYGASTTNSTDQNPNNICYDEAGTYGVQLEISTNCGPATIFYQNIIEVLPSETPVINPSGEISFCDGDNVLLNSTGSGSFQWFQDGNIIPGATSNSFSPVDDGIYTVTLTNDICVATSEPVDVSITSTTPAAITPSNTQNICAGEIVQFVCAGTFDSYQWYQNGLPIVGATSSTYDADESGTYTIEVTIGICSIESNAVTLNVNPVPSPDIIQGSEVTFCADAVASLGLSSSFDTYQWFLNGAAIPGATSINYTPQSSGNYYIQVTENGCNASSEITNVSILAIPDPVIEPIQDITTCAPTAVLLAGNNPNIQWFLNNQPIAGATVNELVATDNGTYYYSTFIDPACPKSSISIEVNLNVPLNLELSASADSACQGEIITITANGNFSNIIWNTSEQTQTIQVDDSGLYIATASDDFCNAVDTAEVIFTEAPEVMAPEDFDSPCTELITLAGTSTGEASWTMNGDLIAMGAEVNIQAPKQTTTYILVAENGDCIARDSVMVRVDCVFIYAPNAFTPDGDGLNDVFRVTVSEIPNYYLRIFDRWGTLVFETDDPEAVWTGGVEEYYVPDGIYVWRIDALDEFNNEVLSKSKNTGTILVVR